jgi:D-glycero-alpha-D-manno-heptose 1-phosphate guanylyltransferase
VTEAPGVVTEAIVLAGGLGTRLRSVVSDIPKAMAPIAGQPFLAYLLQFLEAQGIARVVLAVGYRNDAIRGFFGSRYQGLKLVYSVEDEPLGTGGALLRALPHIDGAYSFVLNGDTFLRLNYPAMAAKLEPHKHERPPDTQLVVALRQVPDATRYGAAVVVEGRIEGFAARGTPGPGLINGGCYLLARDIFERYPMPPKFSWEADFLEARVTEVRPLAFECDAPFIDIGIPEALKAAQTLIPEWLGSVA